jgi:hypothetical protein
MVAMREKKDGDGRGWFVLLLTGLFVGLRLGGVTDWQWYWVLAPQWANLVLGIFLGEDDGEAWLLLLTGLFLGLRLGGVTHWWWPWVFVPLWASTAVGLVTLTAFAGTWLISLFRARLERIHLSGALGSVRTRHKALAGSP